MARHPGRPQVVHARRRGGGDPRRADADRPASSRSSSDEAKADMLTAKEELLAERLGPRARPARHAAAAGRPGRTARPDAGHAGPPAGPPARSSRPGAPAASSTSRRRIDPSLQQAPDARRLALKNADAATAGACGAARRRHPTKRLARRAAGAHGLVDGACVVRRARWAVRARTLARGAPVDRAMHRLAQSTSRLGTRGGRPARLGRRQVDAPSPGSAPRAPSYGGRLPAKVQDADPAARRAARASAPRLSIAGARRRSR